MKKRVYLICFVILNIFILVQLPTYLSSTAQALEITPVNSVIKHTINLDKVSLLSSQQPYVKEATPKNGATNVSLKPNIIIRISEDIERDVLEESFLLINKETKEPVKGEMLLSTSHIPGHVPKKFNAIHFTPNRPLAHGTEYELVLRPQKKNEYYYDIQLPTDFTSTFITETDPVITPDTITSTESSTVIVKLWDKPAEISIKALQEMERLQKTLLIDGKTFKIRIQPQSFELADIPESATVVLNFLKADAESASELFTKAEKQGYQSVRPFNLYNLKISIKDNTKIYQSTVVTKKPLEVSFAFQHESEDSNALNNTALYSYDDETSFWSYAGGKLSPDEGIVTTSLSLPSTYALFTKSVNYVDVPSKHWAQTNIQALSSRGILELAGQNYYPNQPITRGEFAGILVRALVVTGQVPNEPTFEDVDKISPDYRWIELACQAGLLKGNGENFNPKSSITREEVAAVLVRILAWEKGSEAPQSSDLTLAKNLLDYGNISLWAREYVSMALQQELLLGVAPGRFAPKQNITRAEVAAITFRLLQRLERI